MKHAWHIVVTVLASIPLLVQPTMAQAQGKAYRIGALNEGSGPTPGLVGLRDGLVELGYRENVDFFIGTRFTRGDIEALTPARL